MMAVGGWKNSTGVKICKQGVDREALASDMIGRIDRRYYPGRALSSALFSRWLSLIL